MPGTAIGNALLEYLKSKDLIKGMSQEDEDKLKGILIDFFELVIGAVASTQIGKML